MNSILIVEDDQGVQKFLKEFLLDNGFSVRMVGDGLEAMAQIEKLPPDVVILDLGLPNMSGETVCTEVKKQYPHLPIIILTARDTTSDIVQGLNLGADDYMTKPFVADELLARIKARLRADGLATTRVKIADLELDKNLIEVKRNGKLISLTPQEFKLLEYLMNNAGRILTRDMILDRVWSYSAEIESRAVDVYIGYLRKKIDNGSKKKLIHSVRGFGYVIKE
ncbi:response regulator transcription factor [Candidatus Microgenomates bacterium]|nr:response regulator transcription factor [Candidatus Microgenomates bacterium]